MNQEIFDLVWEDLTLYEKSYLTIKAVNNDTSIDGLLNKTIRKIVLLDWENDKTKIL